MPKKDRAPYRDPSLPIERRVDDLLGRMTLDEKVRQLAGVWFPEMMKNGRPDEPKIMRAISRGIGHISRIATWDYPKPVLKNMVAFGNRIQRFLVEKTRLGVPAVIHEECVAGLMCYGATAFPHSIALASAWRPENLRAMATAIRRHVRAIGATHGLSPVLDVHRDARWGRTEETYGEDPYLVAAMAVEYILGLQGDDPRTGVAATLKHFAGHSAPEGGRNLAPVHAGPRELRDVFLFPFEAAVRLARVRSAMNAYHDLDGEVVASSRRILTGILRDEWGFDGVMVSDYSAVQMLHSFHRTATDDSEAAVQAIEAGIDVELPHLRCYGEPLKKAVREGRISIETVDLSVRRVLTAKIEMGLFERPYADVKKIGEVLETPQDRALARRLAREGIVLLKNRGGLLPLGDRFRSILVAGPNANHSRHLFGDYHLLGHIAAKQDTGLPAQSIFEAVRDAAGTRTRVRAVEGCPLLEPDRSGIPEAAAAARQSDLVIAALGEKAGLFGKGLSGEACDRVDICLPGVQQELLQALHAAGKPVVVVMVNGRPIASPWMAANVPAVIEAWYPGEEGAGAIADVLFGKANPGGKLPVTFPKAVGFVPYPYNRRRSSTANQYIDSPGWEPLWSFGHGLSYTRFKYGEFKISPRRIGATDRIDIRCSVKNIGKRAGDEVVQLYVRDEYASVTRPAMELKGFKRLTLKPGEKRRITFHLAAEQLAFHDLDVRLAVEPGDFLAMIGSSSADIRLKGKFKVVGAKKILPRREVFFTAVDVR
jgi:beta-glucosidase